MRFASLMFGMLLAVPGWAASDRPVAAIVDGRLDLVTQAGQGELPLYVSNDWAHSLPDVTRAIVLVPGESREADTSIRIAESARFAAGEAARHTLLVVPQFLTDADIRGRHLTDNVLRWSIAGWIAGEPAEAPTPVSSLAAIDAILARLNDRAMLPSLSQVVVAGHSAGGQLVQRYAVVGKGSEALTRRGVAVRYVVANPSSYLWFGEDRPVSVNRSTCPGIDHWKYGLLGAPTYVGQTDLLEERYIARDVTYLLGESDTDPSHPLLDKSCAAEAQGPTRYVRGMNYLFALELRHPNLVRHRIKSVWGVGHDAGGIFMSPCGLAALFDRPGC